MNVQPAKPIKNSSITSSLINYSHTTNTVELADDRVDSGRVTPTVVDEKSKVFKYNNSTRTPIIQRSKNNLKKKKAQKLARRKNRTK